MAWEREKAAHAAGKRIEYRSSTFESWRIIDRLAWDGAGDYRIHPDDEAAPGIPHADIIRAILDGKAVQIFRAPGWDDVAPTAANVAYIAGYPDGKFRVKPETVVRWSPIYTPTSLGAIRARRDATAAPTQWLRLEFIDGKCVSVTLEDA